MPVHPQADALLQSLAAMGGRPLAELSVAEAREVMAALAAVGAAGEEVASTEDRTLDGPAGSIPVRVYRPAASPERRGAEEPSGPRPTLVWFHGGGWVLGSVEQSDATVRALANASGAVVVSVEYRLAPEAPYPGPLEDSLAATRWCAEHVGELGGDAAALAVGGDSAGGNLAAAVALAVRDEGRPPLAFQLLVYPVTDGRMAEPSMKENAEGYLLTADSMRWFWGHYLGARPEAAEEALASPLRAEDLAGLPAAFVITAEFDPLRDEGEAYAARLIGAGVPTTVRRFDGMIHGFFGLGALLDDGRTAIAEAGAALRSLPVTAAS